MKQHLNLNRSLYNYAQKEFIVICVVFISLFTISFRCEKEIIIPPFEHTFEVPINIFPLKKTYSLTDTIWLETDVSGKILFDTRTNQNINADTGRITFRAGFNEFGTYITSPVNGFCDVITPNGVNVNRENSYWGTVGSFTYGCGQQSYKLRIGYKPNHKGTYYLSLDKNALLESCPTKIIPYNSSISFKYKNVDLNEDIFNSLSKNDQGGNNGTSFYKNEIHNRRLFVFHVE